MLPVIASTKNGSYDVDRKDSDTVDGSGMPALSTLDQARVPIRYMASLFAAGNTTRVEEVYRKLLAVRVHMRAKTVGNVPEAEVAQALAYGETTADEAEAIFRLTSLPTFKERFVIPPMTRELAIEARVDPFQRKQESGFGIRKETPARRF